MDKKARAVHDYYGDILDPIQKVEAVFKNTEKEKFMGGRLADCMMLTPDIIGVCSETRMDANMMHTLMAVLDARVIFANGNGDCLIFKMEEGTVDKLYVFGWWSEEYLFTHNKALVEFLDDKGICDHMNETHITTDKEIKDIILDYYTDQNPELDSEEIKQKIRQESRGAVNL